jgi:hypothetical protein
MAIRFGRIKNLEEWKTMKPNWKAINKQYRKREGTIMFPTSHNITSENKEDCEIVLNKLLEAGNSVLIVIKPLFDIVADWCNKLHSYRDQIEWRFTITSLNLETSKFFEPGAPYPEERINALDYAFNEGYETSGLIEPYLDYDLRPLVKKVEPLCTKSIWIGVMRKDIKFRLLSSFLRQKALLDDKQEKERIWRFVRLLSDLYTVDHVREIHQQFKDRPLIRFKDSIRNILEL